MHKEAVVVAAAAVKAAVATVAAVAVTAALQAAHRLTLMIQTLTLMILTLTMISNIQVPSLSMMILMMMLMQTVGADLQGRAAIGSRESKNSNLPRLVDCIAGMTRKTYVFKT
jgi:hypothetical protein